MDFIYKNWTNIIMIICFIWLLYYSTRKIDNYMNIRDIVFNHYKIFKNDIYQLTTFIIIPCAIAIAFVGKKIYLTQSMLNNINVILAILMAMFFCLLGLIKSLKIDKKNNEEYEKIKQVNLELFNTLLFECFIGVILFLMSFLFEYIKNYYIVFNIYCIIFYYFNVSIFMNIFIILKRTNKLYISTIDN